MSASRPIVGWTTRDVGYPDDEPMPLCRDCNRRMRRDSTAPVYRCPQCGDTVTGAEMERIQAWSDLEEAIADVEHFAHCLREEVSKQVLSDLPRWAEALATGLDEAVETARERLATVESIDADAGRKVER